MSNVTLDAACKTGNAFSYLGQPFEYSNSPGLYLQPKSANNADTQNYLIDLGGVITINGMVALTVIAQTV